MNRCVGAALLSLFVLVLPQGRAGSAERGEGVPALSVSPTEHDFGVLGVPLESKTRVFTVFNAGTADLVVSDIILSDALNYSLDVDAGPNPCKTVTPRVEPGGQCTFSATFFPKSEGILDADIVIVSNDPDAPQISVPLSGFGILCHC